MQEPQPLRYHLVSEKIHAGRIAAGPSEASDKTKPDRIFADTEDDRDRCCCSFGRERSRGCHSWRSRPLVDEPDRPPAPASDRIGPLPMVLDRHVLAFEVTGFLEAFPERAARGAEASADAARRNPTTGIAGCCARAASGQETAAPPTTVMNSRRLMCFPQVEDRTLPRVETQMRLCVTAKFGRSCPLWVKSGRDALKFRCPLYPRKRTSVDAI